MHDGLTFTKDLGFNISVTETDSLEVVQSLIAILFDIKMSCKMSIVDLVNLFPERGPKRPIEWHLSYHLFGLLVDGLTIFLDFFCQCYVAIWFNKVY